MSPSKKKGNASTQESVIPNPITLHVAHIIERMRRIKCVKISRYVTSLNSADILICSTCKETHYQNQECILESFHVLYEGCIHNTNCYHCHTSHYQIRPMINCPECAHAFRQYSAHLHNNGRSLLQDRDEIVITMGILPPEIVPLVVSEAHAICLGAYEHTDNS